MNILSTFRRWSKSRGEFKGFGGGFEARNPGANGAFSKTSAMLRDGIKQEFINRDGCLNRDVMPVVNSYLADVKTKSMLCGMNKQEGDACRLNTLFKILTGKNSDLINAPTRSEVAATLKQRRAERAGAERYMQTASGLLKTTALPPSIS